MVVVLCMYIVKVPMLHLSCGSCGSCGSCFGTVSFPWLLLRFEWCTKLKSHVGKMKNISLSGVLRVIPSDLNLNQEEWY